MRRVLRLGVAGLLSMAFVSPTHAEYSNAIFTTPCWFEARENPDLVFVDNIENYRDTCTEVGAKLTWRVCPACSTMVTYDYDPLYAVVDQPNNYVFTGAFARATDDGVTGQWRTW